MNEQDMKEIAELMDAISPGPWEWTSHKPERGGEIESVEDVVELLAKSARQGSGLYLHGVGAKQGGEDIVIAYTGNGPRSAENARFLSCAPKIIDALLAESARLRAEVERMKKDCAWTQEVEARNRALSDRLADAEFVVRGGDKDMALKILRGEKRISDATAKAENEGEAL